MSFEYLFFDLDGTLTDPALGITNSFIYALKKHNIEVKERSELYKFIGPPLFDSFKTFGMSDEEANQAVADYREYFSDKGLLENSVIEGIPEALKAIKEKGYKLVIATSKPEPFAIRILDYFKLSEYFEFVSGALFVNGKRNKKGEVIRHALESLNINEPWKVLMIGDRFHDIEGAKENNIKSMGVTFGYGTREELAGAGADFVADTVEEMVNAIA
ncbi:MAG: HAD-IA family hydrolase [Lachnospiraceae bacterium]|nr:HAD-IA family hydrolase [Lachnospiraceae bacterium]